MRRSPSRVLVFLIVALTLATLSSLPSTSAAERQSYVVFKVHCGSSPDRGATVYLLYDGYQDDVSKTNGKGMVTFPVVPNSGNYSYSVYYKGYQNPIRPFPKDTPPPGKYEEIKVTNCGAS
jgi:hypothetical protein